MPATTPYSVSIGSAFTGHDGLSLEVPCPVDPMLAYEIGSARPSAQSLANYFAGEYCDSGTVSVQRGSDKGHVSRRALS